MALLGTELLSVEWEPTRPPEPAAPAAGLTRDGAPKVHETNVGGETQLGFQPATPWRHTEGDE